MSVKVYLDEDADLSDLQNKVCAVIGFGSQGHAHALNRRDSGIEVIVGLYPGSKSIPIAQEYGLRVLDVAEAAQQADAEGPCADPVTPAAARIVRARVSAGGP